MSDEKIFIIYGYGCYSIPLGYSDGFPNLSQPKLADADIIDIVPCPFEFLGESVNGYVNESNGFRTGDFIVKAKNGDEALNLVKQYIDYYYPRYYRGFKVEAR